MIQLGVKADLTGILQFLASMEDFFLGGSEFQPHRQRLGDIAVEGIKESIEAGGSGRFAGGVTWPRTSPYWVELRGKGDDRPLIATGSYQSSFAWEPLGSKDVRVGPHEGGGSSAYLGAYRHQFGDPPGHPWYFTPPGSHDTETLAEHGAEGVRLHPVIKARPHIDIFQEQVDVWWIEVGAHYGFS